MLPKYNVVQESLESKIVIMSPLGKEKNSDITLFISQPFLLLLLFCKNFKLHIFYFATKNRRLVLITPG